jgi:sulfite reductase (ferredoxin)
MAFAKGFVDACRAATEQMGKDLKLAPVDKAAAGMTNEPPKVEPVVASVAAPAVSSAPVYDLRGVACPMNYVKTKLKLEMMDAGEQLEVWLDAGEPIKNVPLSLKNDGHKLLLQEPLEAAAAHYRILVEKVE